MLPYAAAIALFMMAVTILIHYETLRAVSVTIPKIAVPDRCHVLVIVTAVLAAHLFEVFLYACTFYIMQHHLGLGAIAGNVSGDALDFFYFSIVSYTTLGIGDMYPVGPLRLVMGIEALNGLVLITWTASFTYISMQKLWPSPESDRDAQSKRAQEFE